MQDRLKALKKTHGAKELGQVTVNMVIGGMRGIPVRPHEPRTGLHTRETWYKQRLII